MTKTAKEYHKEYYAKNKEKILAKNRAWKEANPDRAKNIVQNWQKKNSEKEKIRRKVSRENNIEEARKYHREWNKRQRAKKPEQHKAIAKRAREKNYDKILADNRKWSNKNPDKQNNIRLKSRYGITLEEFDGMLIEQAGRCLICDDPMRKPVVDHCHNSRKVRGLLCQLCNAAIGMLKDDPRVIAAALAYVRKD